jgi:RNA polymerase sigma-70 factor (ECF subfamily)
MPATVWARQDSATDDEVPDAALVARARYDRDAFGLLYDRHVEAVYRYCYGRLRSREAAEDATSVIFTKALAALPSHHGQSFRSWLFAIAHNTLADGHRTFHGDRPLTDAVEVEDPGPPLDDLAAASERRRSVARALTSLSEEQRRVVELRLAGLTGPEIARLLGRSHDSVRTTQRRALARLREILGIAPDAEEGRNAS